MTNVATITPLNQFFDTNGAPLNSGYLYFGLPNQDPEQFQAQMYWDAAGTVPALQPVRTISGYPSRAGSPAIIYGPDSYSLRVKNSASVQVLYAPELGGLATSASLSGSGGSALVGFLQSGTGAIARTIQDKGRDVVSVFDFMTSAQIADVKSGSKTLDTSAAIQAATNYTTARGQSLFFPAGIYKLLSFVTLPSNTDWIGEVGTSIYLDPTMTLGAVIGGTARAVYANTASNISIAKIKFNSITTGLTKAITIALSSVTRLRLQDCSFEDFGNATYYAQGLIIYGSSNVDITGCRFNNCSGDGLALSNSVTNYYIHNNEFSSNGDWGCALVVDCNNGIVIGNSIQNNTSTGTGVDRCQNVTFIGNTIQNNEHGIRIAEFAVTAEKNSHIAILGNTIKTVGVAGISIEGLKAVFGIFTVSGNTVEGSSNQGIRVIDGEVGTIANNAIYSCAAEGILVQSATAGRTTGNITITGNAIHTATYGIRQITTAGTSTRISVVNNLISGTSIAALALLSVSVSIDTTPTNFTAFSLPLGFPSAITSGSATTGGTALPANAQGFLPLYMGTTLYKIPFYNA